MPPTKVPLSAARLAVAGKSSGLAVVTGEPENPRLASLRASRSAKDATSFFPECESDDLYASDAPWPELTACLGILFTSRSGSTFLSRELEKRYAVGRIRESFNLPVLRSRGRKTNLKSPAAALRYSILQLQEGGWFGFKAGRPGLIVAERCGFFNQYLPRTSFILLLRRDIVAQAVSLVKAKSTSLYHSSQRKKRTALPAEYSCEHIGKAVKTILNGVREIAAYADRANRPCEKAYYEDFAQGEFQTIDTICRAFGVPKRVRAPGRAVREVEKIGDQINVEWCARFRAQMDDTARRHLNEYQTCLQH